jgi:hypothetical protein
MAKTDASYIRSELRFGEKPSTVTSYNLIWPVAGTAGPAYININSAQTIELASTSATDTASGAGMRAVTIRGMGATLQPITETVWTDGTSPVSTVNEFTRVLRMFGLRGNDNVGSVYLGYGTFTSGVPDNILASIQAGQGQTVQLTSMIANSQTALVTGFEFNIGKDGGGQNILGTFQLRTRTHFDLGNGLWESGPWRTRYIGSTISALTYFAQDNDAFQIDGPCDIEVRILGSGTGARASAQVHFELHKKLQ